MEQRINEQQREVEKLKAENERLKDYILEDRKGKDTKTFKDIEKERKKQ